MVLQHSFYYLHKGINYLIQLVLRSLTEVIDHNKNRTISFYFISLITFLIS